MVTPKPLPSLSPFSCYQTWVYSLIPLWPSRTTSRTPVCHLRNVPSLGLHHRAEAAPCSLEHPPPQGWNAALLSWPSEQITPETAIQILKRVWKKPGDPHHVAYKLHCSTSLLFSKIRNPSSRHGQAPLFPIPRETNNPDGDFGQLLLCQNSISY